MAGFRFSKLSIFAAFLFVTASVHAGDVDIAPYFTRVTFTNSPVFIAAAILLLTTLNYGLNLLIIGLPAIRFGGAKKNAVRRDLIYLTVCGQIADRVGALAAVLLTISIASMGVFRGGPGITLLFALNVLFSALSVGFLASYFLIRRWKVPSEDAWAIAFAAAIFTNPLSVIGVLYLITKLVFPL